MPKNKISEYSSTAADNTDIGGINIAEGMLPSDVNNAMREQMAQLKEFLDGSSGDTITTAKIVATTAEIKSGANVTGTATFNSAVIMSSNLTLNAQSDIRLADSDSSNWVAFQAPATVASNVTWTLPAADGTSGQVLSTNGSGTLSWATGGGGSLTGKTNSASPFETSLGSGAGAVNTGVNNTFVGFEAGNDNTTGTNNTALGYQALDVNTTGVQNVAVGSGALGANTTGGYAVAVGYEALKANTTADGNVAIGRQALLSNTTGAYNIAIGVNSLPANTSGGQNIAIGVQTLRLNTAGGKNVAIGGETAGNTTSAMDQNETGGNNVAVGAGALRGNTTASFNNAIGVNALYANTTGQFNVALGFDALASNTTASNNTGIGRDALKANTTGVDNTAVGYQAGDVITTGSRNVCIGTGTDPSANNGTDQIVIGTNIAGQGNSNVTIGSSGGKIYNAFTVNATWTQTSDERLKKNIQDDTLGLSFVNRLRPVKYQWKPSNEIDPSLPYYNEVNQRNTEAVMHGLVAQEVKAALDAEGVTTFAGWDQGQDTIQAISREMFISPLIKAVQELSAKCDALQAEIDTLKGN